MVNFIVTLLALFARSCQLPDHLLYYFFFFCYFLQSCLSIKIFLSFFSSFPANFSYFILPFNIYFAFHSYYPCINILTRLKYFQYSHVCIFKYFVSDSAIIIQEYWKNKSGSIILFENIFKRLFYKSTNQYTIVRINIFFFT